MRSRGESAKDRQPQIPTHIPRFDATQCGFAARMCGKAVPFREPASAHAAAPPIADLRQSRRIAVTLKGKAKPFRTSGRQAAKTANRSASPAGFVQAKLRAFFQNSRTLNLESWIWNFCNSWNLESKFWKSLSPGPPPIVSRFPRGSCRCSNRSARDRHPRARASRRPSSRKNLR